MPDLEHALDAVDRCVNDGDEDAIAAIFDESFLSVMPATQLLSLFDQIRRDYGCCSSHEIQEMKSDVSAVVRWRFDRGFHSEGIFTVTETEPARVLLLNFGLPQRDDDSWEQAVAAASGLPGRVGLVVRDLTRGEDLACLEPDLPLGVGSVSKLVIFTTLLDALAAEELDWREVLSLEEEHLSAPSGVMHDWPVGAPITLHTAAVALLSLSDNTAADLLLAKLGRPRVEGTLHALGIPGLRPFPSTRGIFGFASGPPERRQKWLHGSDAERLELLREVEACRPRTGDQTPEPWDEGHGWYLSSREVVLLLARLREQIAADPSASAVMAMSTGGIASPSWRFVGYKGGSSPGRLSLSVLLGDGDERWVGACMTVNATPKELSVTKVGTLFKRMTDLALRGSG